MLIPKPTFTVTRIGKYGDYSNFDYGDYETALLAVKDTIMDGTFVGARIYKNSALFGRTLSFEWERGTAAEKYQQEISEYSAGITMYQGFIAGNKEKVLPRYEQMLADRIKCNDTERRINKLKQKIKEVYQNMEDYRFQIKIASLYIEVCQAALAA